MILAVVPPSRSRTFGAYALAAKVNATYEEHRHAIAAGIVPGPRTGLGLLDEALGGWLREGIYVLHGSPGVGKTAFAMQVAIDARMPVLFVTCEMAPEELFLRIMGRFGGAGVSLLRSARVMPEVFAKAQEHALEMAHNLRFLDALQKAPTHDAMALELAETPVRLVVIDSLHAWALRVLPGLPEYEALNAGMDTLRQLAAQFHIPFLVVSERNRSSMQSGGLHAAAGTRRIEYGCEAMLDFKLDEEGDDNPRMRPKEAKLTVRIVKNRYGPPWVKIPMVFDGIAQEFRER